MDRDSAWGSGTGGRGSPCKPRDGGGWVGSTGNGAHSDTTPQYDTMSRGGKHHQKGNQGRRAKNYRKLWEHVKSVHAGDSEGGRPM